MDILDTGKVFYDWETKNISFLQVSEDLRRLGIKNNMFFLRLYDRGLQGVDPHSSLISEEMAFRIMTECSRNPWYYLREVCRIPDQGNDKGIPYKLNRANLAATWCFVNNIDHYLTIPRQVGKTQSIIANLTRAYLFGTSNSQMAFFATDAALASENLERLKAQRSLLPKYLQLNQSCVVDEVLGTKDKEIDNVQKIYNPLTKNSIVCKGKATSLENGRKLGRGNTLPITYIDEVEFVNYVDEIVKSAGPAFSTAAANAERNKAAYCRIFSSTPGDLDSQSGRAAATILENTYRWTEQFYDIGPVKAKEMIEASSDNGIVYIEYSYKQLGLDDKWFRKMCKLVENDPVAIKRELLLHRIRGSKDSPFDEEDLMAIQEIRPSIIEEFIINDLYKVDVYRKLRNTVPYLVGVDCSTGAGVDNSAVTIVNPYTLQIDAEFRSSVIGTPDLKRFLFTLVRKYIPNALLCIEKNHCGDAIIQDLCETVIRRNIYYNSSKELVGDNVVKVEKGSIQQEVEKRRLRGVYTGKKSRGLMIDLLFETVREHKDRLTSKFIIDDILKLVRKGGKVQAASGAHDDSIMSYLIALYVYFYGKNLNIWGIVKGAKEPGFEETDNSQEEDAYEYMKNNLSESDLGYLTEQMRMERMYEDQMKRVIAEAQYLSRLDSQTNQISDVVKVEDVDSFDIEYDYDKSKSSGASTIYLNEFDDLNDW